MNNRKTYINCANILIDGICIRSNVIETYKYTNSISEENKKCNSYGIVYTPINYYSTHIPSDCIYLPLGYKYYTDCDNNILYISRTKENDKC